MSGHSGGPPVTHTDHHIQDHLGILVLVVYLKPEAAENTTDFTNKTT